MTTHPIPDVLVIGAGAIGASCAAALAAGGARVTLLERGTAAGEAWRASAGMIAAQIEGSDDNPLLPLGVASRALLRRQAPQLLATTGIDIAPSDGGIVQLARGRAETELAHEQVAMQRQRGLRAAWLDADEVADRWPWLARGHGAFWSPEDGAVDPAQLVAAYRAEALRNGARLIEDTAIALDRSGDRLRGVIGAAASYPAGEVVIAAGAWSGRIEGLPRPLSVEPVRGQMIAYPWPNEIESAVVYGAGCYLLRRGDDMLVGATVEHVGFDASVTDDAIADLRRRAALVYPGIASAQVLRSWAGLRPGTPDGLPIIGREPRLPGLWYATGHGRNGILLAALTGDVIARAVAGEAPGEDFFATRPERFWS